MAYYISHMIGIRTGGVFSGSIDTENMKDRIKKIILEMREAGNEPDLGDEGGDPSDCMSNELSAHKGSYVVLAGVFNYWNFDEASEFVKRLSEEFGSEVMHMAWDEQNNHVQCQIWLDGKPLFEVSENPVGQILRRVM